MAEFRTSGGWEELFAEEDISTVDDLKEAITDIPGCCAKCPVLPLAAEHAKASVLDHVKAFRLVQNILDASDRAPESEEEESDFSRIIIEKAIEAAKAQGIDIGPESISVPTKADHLKLAKHMNDNQEVKREYADDAISTVRALHKICNGTITARIRHNDVEYLVTICSSKVAIDFANNNGGFLPSKVITKDI